MRWTEMTAEQQQPLDYKIERAQAAIAEARRVSKHYMAVAFSGGKDSTVLLHLLRESGLRDILVILGNTGVEYPESINFARELARNWNLNFHEAHPGKTQEEGFRYAGQQAILAELERQGRVREVLKADGKLKSTKTLEAACPAVLAERLPKWPAGTTMGYWWCVDQYGWPLLGKSWSRLEARRINIDCFLRYSQSVSEDARLAAYYDVLRMAKVSQACCGILKKEPSERIQAELDVDLIFKGLMAGESRARAKNFLVRGYLAQGRKRPYLQGDAFWHCQPMAIWTEGDVWEYIRRFSVPYSKLYDMGYTDRDKHFVKIRRNGCMGCATDILFPHNHMSMLRHTHPGPWETFMKRGMAGEIQNLQRARRRGQMSLFDVYGPEELLRIRPCIFDRVDELVLQDDEEFGPVMVVDPEAENEDSIKVKRQI